MAPLFPRPLCCGFLCPPNGRGRNRCRGGWRRAYGGYASGRQPASQQASKCIPISGPPDGTTYGGLVVTRHAERPPAGRLGSLPRKPADRVGLTGWA